MAKYSYKPGFRSKVKASVAGRELERIRKSNGGLLTPELVLSEAASPKSPLHNHFLWDDSEASDRYRRQQASQLIVCVRVVMVQDPEERPRMAYLNVRRWRKDSRYLPATEAMSDNEVRTQILERAASDAEAFAARYREIEELADLCSMILKAAQALRGKKKRRRKAAKAGKDRARTG